MWHACWDDTTTHTNAQEVYKEIPSAKLMRSIRLGGLLFDLDWIINIMFE
jgi:hypothetical protein